MGASRLGPPVDGDHTGVETRELLEGTDREVKRVAIAGGAGVGDGGLDGLAVVLDPDGLAAKAAVHLRAVDGDNDGFVGVVVTARAGVTVLVVVGRLTRPTGSLLHRGGNDGGSGGKGRDEESRELHGV